jgi:adenylate cyclase
LATERLERRLAAILAADIAGYSRLMGADEEGTLARLRAHRRELIDPKISEHRGRIVKTTGDGILIESPSVIEAVCCAVAPDDAACDLVPQFEDVLERAVEAVSPDMRVVGDSRLVGLDEAETARALRARLKAAKAIGLAIPPAARDCRRGH